MNPSEYRKLLKKDSSILRNLGYLEKLVFKMHVRGELAEEIAIETGLSVKHVEDLIHSAGRKLCQS